MRASGYPGRAATTMLIGAVINVALDPLFIYVFGWGIEGAAWATDIAMAVSAIFVVAHFCRRDTTVRFRRGIYTLRLKIITGIISIGAAPALVNTAACLVNMLANPLAPRPRRRPRHRRGRHRHLQLTPRHGSARHLHGHAARGGLQLRRGKLHRLRKAYLLAVAAASAITVAEDSPPQPALTHIARVFTTDADLIAATDRALATAMLVFPVVGFQIISTSFFQSIGNATESIIVGLLRQVIFLIPLLIILPRTFGVDGVWMSFRPAIPWLQ